MVEGVLLGRPSAESVGPCEDPIEGRSKPPTSIEGVNQPASEAVAEAGENVAVERRSGDVLTFNKLELGRRPVHG